MKKLWKANIVVEAAVILPMVLMIFGGIVLTFFYFHDKNIVIGAAYEILTVESEEKNLVKEKLGERLQERLNHKLILFSQIYVEIRIEEDEITMSCMSQKNPFQLQIQVSMSRTRPEQYIRNVRRLQRIEKQMGES